MIPTIYVDECLSRLIVNLLRKEGANAIYATDIGMNGKNDEEQLIFAKQKSYILITNDKKDFSKIAKKFTDHKGIIIISKSTPLGAYPKMVESILDKLTIVQDWSQMLIWISP
ncbi:MAG: DUF5615 family PIN-like protein [Candidatus Nanoarchaeia archaeon]|nr:DUF5615 family PIN-like protein [Candidatus Nanoarchaeia archaeon]